MISPQKECDYCEQYSTHGGKCYGNRKSYTIPCLGFKKDPRGRIEFASGSRFKIKINEPIPELGKWSDDYTLQGKETPIKITKVTPLKWITERMIAIECRIEFYYYDNSEYGDQGEKQMAQVIPIRRDI
ncbi:hypothetical protein [Sporomusa malonica]|uniref:Uncharacterized protein n=1 Tax=Sporomusa malonica TaxID=112901 RepID=A0A1W2AT89_9FIRM|nr:hypothetical protein [Sporomusa malonica]SMC63907.1 hypothetical protein SAMN04488500_10698 [Sporomusa malonica]